MDEFVSCSAELGFLGQGGSSRFCAFEVAVRRPAEIWRPEQQAARFDSHTRSSLAEMRFELVDSPKNVDEESLQCIFDIEQMNQQAC